MKLRIYHWMSAPKMRQISLQFVSVWCDPCCTWSTSHTLWFSHRYKKLVHGKIHTTLPTWIWNIFLMNYVKKGLWICNVIRMLWLVTSTCQDNKDGILAKLWGGQLKNPGRHKRYFSSPKHPDWLWGPPSLLFSG